MPGERYALSYRWGDFTGYTSQRRDFQGHMLPLGDKNLPRTVADAVELASATSLKYLWVDSLCILQDDPEDVKAHVHYMDSVYQGASLTIIDAGGEKASAGLEGFQPGWRRWALPRATLGGFSLSTPSTLSALRTMLEAF